MLKPSPKILFYFLLCWLVICIIRLSFFPSIEVICHTFSMLIAGGIGWLWAHRDAFIDD